MRQGGHRPSIIMGAMLPAALLAGSCTREPGQASVPPPHQAPPIAAERLVIGVSNYYSDNVGESLQPLATYLSEELGIPVEVRVADAYRDLSALLLAGEVDVAQIPPLVYVRLKKRVPDVRALVTPIIGGSPSYLGHVYVRQDAPYQSLADLRGARIAYVSRDSVSGYLFARHLVRRLGTDPDEFFTQARFYRSHPAVLQAVLDGEADVGAAFDISSDWTSTRERPDGLKVIAKTERIANDCMVARPGYDPGTQRALTEAMLRLRPTRVEAERVLEPLRINGWVRADEHRFERIREVLAQEPRNQPDAPYEPLTRVRFGQAGR